FVSSVRRTIDADGAPPIAGPAGDILAGGRLLAEADEEHAIQVDSFFDQEAADAFLAAPAQVDVVPGVPHVVRVADQIGGVGGIFHGGGPHALWRASLSCVR